MAISLTDPRFIMDPYDWLAAQQLNAGVPDIFQVFLSTAQQLVIFRVGTTNIGRSRHQVAGYNIHFIASTLVSASTIYSLEAQEAALAISDIVISTGAPGPGGIVQVSSASQYGKAGYYFAVPFGSTGLESRFFAGPVPAPLPGSLVTAVTPPDVSNPAVVVTTETVNQRSARKLTFSATVPSNGQQGVIAILGGGTGGTPGARLAVSFSGGGGSGASATAVVNASGNVNSPPDIILATTGSGYATPPTVTVPGLASGTFEAVLGQTTDFAGYQIYMSGYFGGTLKEMQVISGGNVGHPNSTMSGFIYLLPDVSASPPPAVTFYFVSITSKGSRRPDPTSSPSVTLAGGLP